jgi:hypothetical protein
LTPNIAEIAEKVKRNFSAWLISAAFSLVSARRAQPVAAATFSLYFMADSARLSIF